MKWISQLERLIVCCLALLACALPALAQNPAVTISVDANANRHAISPFIYGVAYGSTTQLIDLNAPLNRYGGNPTTRYNWQLNADNRDNDYYFESIGDASAVAGERGDTFFSNSKAGGAQPLLTIPTLGWVAKLGPSRSKLASFSVAKYGAQQSTDPYFPDAGNGVLPGGQLVTGNDPNDADVPADSTYQQGWVQHLVNTWGTASNGGLKYYILDNEPSIWHSTHRDVHPTGATMAEIRDKILDYASKIKAVDPTALVIGPEEWGWSGYFYSGYDQQYGSLHGWSSLPDRNNNGGQDYLPWLLSQLHTSDMSTGKRSLDVFSVHYYPQGGEFGNDTSDSTQLLRNQSTRSLWDPNYKDQSWIADYVQLIPRLKNWVATYYPGLKTAITEYNWGAESHINGATTQADIYGIFGREGLDMATRWTTPDPSTPTYLAMKLYRNYDGHNSGFGDTSVSATVPNPDNLSAFAAVRSSDGALTVMVINKVLPASPPVNTDVTINLANFTGGSSAQVWQLTSANAITQLASASVVNNTITASVPAQSITLFVVPIGGKHPEIVFQNQTTNQVSVWYMNAAMVLGNASLSLTPAAGYKVVAIGDFKADGNADVVYQNQTTNQVAIWFLNGVTYTNSGFTSLTPATGWKVVGSGDFNGDGKADLVFQNQTTNQVAIWYMNGLTYTGSGFTSLTPSTGWKVVGVGDFNGDGHPDLVFQNQTTNQVAVWYMNGLKYVSGAYTSLTPATGWKVVGVGDFNGDGHPDLVFQNQTSGLVAIWFMNGTTFLSGAYTSMNPAAGWQVVGPH